MSGAGVVRFTANFANTETLSGDQDLWIEVEVDGVLEGDREIIKRATYAFDALNGVPSGFTIMGDTDTSPPRYSYTGDYLTTGAEGWKVKANIGTIRNAHAAATVNGRIYVSGGWNDGGAYLATTAEEYDPATDTWRPEAKMGSIRGYHSAATVNGKIYVSGGWNGGAVVTTEEYSPGKYFIHRKD